MEWYWFIPMLILAMVVSYWMHRLLWPGKYKRKKEIT